MTTTTPAPGTDAPDFAAIKQKQQVNWSAGNYAVIGTSLQLMGESLCEAVDLSAGWNVLDVAAGNGNASLAAARRGCEVTAVDYVPSLLEQLDARAAAEGLKVTTAVGDAEALDVPDGAFDAVLSTVGVMFTPNPPQAASELVRACRSGGKIGLANWTPSGFVGQMFKTLGGYVPPPPGVSSPMLWGTEEKLQEWFGDSVSSLTCTEKLFTFRFRTAEEFVEVFRTYYGPMTKAFESLDDEGRTGLATDLAALADQHNAATDGTVKIPSTYLEIVATKA